MLAPSFLLIDYSMSKVVLGNVLRITLFGHSSSSAETICTLYNCSRSLKSQTPAIPRESPCLLAPRMWYKIVPVCMGNHDYTESQPSYLPLLHPEKGLFQVGHPDPVKKRHAYADDRLEFGVICKYYIILTHYI